MFSGFVTLTFEFLTLHWYTTLKSNRRTTLSWITLKACKTELCLNTFIFFLTPFSAIHQDHNVYTSGVIIGHQSNSSDAKKQDFNSSAQGGGDRKVTTMPPLWPRSVTRPHGELQVTHALNPKWITGKATESETCFLLTSVPRTNGL